MSDPTGPFVWQCCELPTTSISGSEYAFFREVPPPPGYMLHSWSIAPIGTLVICWVRMPRDLGSDLALMLLDKTQKGPKP